MSEAQSPEGFSAAELSRYASQFELAGWSPARQAALRAASVFVIGAGSLGGVAAGYVTAAGAGRISIVDGGQIETTGLHRQLLSYAPETGLGIADAVAAKLALINPEVHVAAYPAHVDESNADLILAEASCVIEGTNSPEARLLVNDACLRLRIPLVAAGTGAVGGWLMTVLPGETACLRCATRAFPRIDGSGNGRFGPIAGAIASLQAVEAIKLASEFGAPRAGELLTLAGESLELSHEPVSRGPDCICARGTGAGNL